MSTDFDPNKVADWHGVLAKTALALRANPNDTEARDWQQRALQNIADIESRGQEADTREAQDMGGGNAFLLGAARGASFGLGDLAQKVALSPQERQSVATTGQQHRGLSLAGNIAGGAVPFAFGGALPGMSAKATQVALGAAAGAGLTPGGASDRAVGAATGAGGAVLGPAIFKGLGAVAGRGGRLLRGLAALSEGRSPVIAAEDIPSSASGWNNALRGARPVLEDTPGNQSVTQAERDALDALTRTNAERSRLGMPARQADPQVVGNAKPISEGSPGSAQQAQASPGSTLSQSIPQPVDYNAHIHEPARAAHALVEAATGDPETATQAARRVAGHAAGARPYVNVAEQRGMAATEPSVLEPALKASVRITQILRGHPTPEAVQELQQAAKDLPAGLYEGVLRMVNQTPAWRAALVGAR